jgi:hypothetical protein
MKRTGSYNDIIGSVTSQGDPGNSASKAREEYPMKSKVLLSLLLTALFVLASSCGTSSNCPVCGTTSNGAYAVIDVIAVPEHNPTGEPGGPFNSFDISTIAPNVTGTGGPYLDFISDRIGLSMDVIDTSQNLAVNAIQGANAVTDNGDSASACFQTLQPNYTGAPPTPTVGIIPPTADVFGNFTRYGCRTDMSWQSGPTFHLNTGFGPNGLFGGFPGAQCCAARANGVNPMSGPNGNTTTIDGKFLLVGNGSSTEEIFDLTTMGLGTNPPTPPTLIANIPTGVAGDWDGPQGISGCIASWQGEAGSAYDCGDDRADEQAEATVTDSAGNQHQILAIINGDPGLPFVTFMDLTNVIGKTGTLQQQHCLPLVPYLAYGPYPAGYDPTTQTYPYPSVPGGPFGYPLQATGTGIPGTGVSGAGTPLPSPVLDPTVGGSFNPPSCIIGQIYYDGAGGLASGGSGAGYGLNSTFSVDTVPVPGTPGGTFPCPDPSSVHVFSGVSGSVDDGPAGDPGFGVLPTGSDYVIPCHHGPLLDQTFGIFCNQSAPGSNCAGAVAPAGLGQMAFDPATGYVLLTNSNSLGSSTAIGNLDVINLQLGVNTCTNVAGTITGQPCGPVVIGTIVTPNCMPGSIVQGPGENFLIGCADHDGEAFPPNEYVINLSGGFNASSGGYNVNCVGPMVNCVQVYNTGGVDEIWYNPGDNKYYLAARDLPTGAAMGVVDANSNEFLVNFPTNTNSHSIAVDPSTNHAFVPMQAGTICETQSANGCVGVVGEQ